MSQQDATPEDIQQNKAMAIIAYFIFFIPLLAAKESAFARYHSNQGLVLLIAYVALRIVQGILNAILIAAMTLSGIGALWIFSAIFTIAYLGLAALGIIGILNAVQGRMKPIPLIGTITIIK